MKSELKKTFWDGNKKLFVVAFIANLLASSINFYLSYILQVVTDIAAGEEQSKDLLQIVMECAVVLFLMILIFLILAGTQNAFKARAMRQYRDAVYDRVSKKGIGAFRKENTATYVSGLTNDAGIIEENYLGGLFGIG